MKKKKTIRPISSTWDLLGRACEYAAKSKPFYRKLVAGEDLFKGDAVTIKNNKAYKIKG